MKILTSLITTLVAIGLITTGCTRTINNETVREIHDPAGNGPTGNDGDKPNTPASSRDYSGGVSDGGGGAVVCRDNDLKVTSAEMLDLYEARVYQGRQLKDFGNASYLDIADQMAKMIDDGGATYDPTAISIDVSRGVKRRQMSLMPYDGSLQDHPSMISDEIRRLDDKKRLLPPGNKLETLHDSNPVVLPAGNCQIEQLAIYRDNSSRLYVVGDIWDKMKEDSRAAFLIHEALYRSMRTLGETTSDRARAAVGMAFTDYKFEWLLDGVPDDSVLCWSDDDKMSYRFAAIPSTMKDRVTLQFIYLEGQLQLTKTTLEVPINGTIFGEKATGDTLAIYQFASGINEASSVALSIGQDESGDHRWTMQVPVLALPMPLKYNIVCSRNKLSPN